MPFALALYNAETNDMPPRYRLACQCFIRDEDILVTFEGDQVLPAKKPHLTPASKIFKSTRSTNFSATP